MTKKNIPPLHFSWRGLPSLNFPVRPQTGAACCASMAVAGLVSQKLKDCEPSIVDFEVSVQELIDNVPKKYPEAMFAPPDRRGVYLISAEMGLDYVEKYGITLASHYRYEARRQEDNEPPLFPRVYVNEVKTMYWASRKSIKKLLFQTPIIGRISVYESFRKFRGKTIYRKNSGCYMGEHIVMVIGYGVDKHKNDYLHIRNSWGEQWGNNGYARIRFDLVQAVCFIDGVAWIVIAPDQQIVKRAV